MKRSQLATLATLLLAWLLAAAADPASAVAEAPLDVRLGQHIGAAISSGSFVLAVLIAFAAGVVVSLSPCVYPLIPITIAVFGGRAQTSYRRGFWLSLCYVVGMALFYSAAAVVFSLLGLASGSFMAIPAVVLTIAAIGLAMSLSLVGAFELVLPASWMTRLSTIGGAGAWGAFRMGLVAGIIAAPCAGPVLIFILALIAKQGQILLGVALMVAYALGIGLLFLVLGTFSQLITRLPKSGPWMETVRGTLGYGMLFASFYLAVPHLHFLEGVQTLASGRTLVIGGIAAVAAGVAIGALHLSFHDGVRSHFVRKTIGMVLCGAGAVVLIEVLVTAPVNQLAWRSDHDAALAAAKAEQRPVLIDFGAEWCVACKELEHKTFTAAEFAKAAERFVLVRVDCTELTDEISALWERYGIQGLPNIVFVDSTGRALTEPRVTTFLPVQQFVAEMAKVR